MAKIKPAVTEVDGIASPARKQAVQVAQGLQAWVEWVLRDDDGNPVDITALGFASSSSSSASSEAGGTIKLRAVECLSISGGNPPAEVDGEAVDPAAGVVKARLPRAVVALPGVYVLEWAVYGPEGDLEHVSTGSLVVNRGLSTGTTGVGPPTIQEIRLHLRDSGPEDNYLLDAQEFDLAEIAACVERAVQIWNETLAFVPRRYNTSNFPYRSKWLDCCAGHLFMLASHNYDRNLQAYSAGGTSMQDKNKGPGYMQKGMAIIQEYKDWVKQRKGQINMESAFGSTSEGY